MYETYSSIYHNGKLYVEILKCFFVFFFSFFVFLVCEAKALFSLPHSRGSRFRLRNAEERVDTLVKCLCF
jgi:hypothetical protein